MTLSTTTPLLGEEVTLSFTASDADGDITNCIVDFGDGERQEIEKCTGTQTLKHTYQAEGDFTVKVTVTDSQGESVSQSAVVKATATPPNVAPVIENFRVSPDAPYAERETTFSFSVSDAEGDDITCIVDFGDGETQEVTSCAGAQSVTHTYAAEGNYEAVVIAKDASGSVKATMTVQVQPKPLNTAPVIESFTMTPENPKVGEEVTFSFSVSDAEGDDVSCVVDFGDGKGQEISNCMGQQTIQQIYSLSSNISMIIEAKDTAGNKISKISEFSVSPKKVVGVNSLTVSESKVLKGDSVVIDWNLSGLDEGVSCVFSMNKIDQFIVSECQSNNSLTVFPDKVGENLLEVRVISNGVITDKESITVESYHQRQAAEFIFYKEDNLETQTLIELAESNDSFKSLGYKIAGSYMYEDTRDEHSTLVLSTEGSTRDRMDFIILDIFQNNAERIEIARFDMVKDSVELVNLQTGTTEVIQGLDRFLDSNQQEDLMNQIENIYSPLEEKILKSVNSPTTFFRYKDGTAIQIQSVPLPDEKMSYCRDCSTLYNNYQTVRQQANNELAKKRFLTIAGLASAAVGNTMIVTVPLAGSVMASAGMQILGVRSTIYGAAVTIASEFSTSGQRVEALDKRADLLLRGWKNCQDPYGEAVSGWYPATIATVVPFFGKNWYLKEGLYNTRIATGSDPDKLIIINFDKAVETYNLLSGRIVTGARKDGDNISANVWIPAKVCVLE